MRPKLYSVRCVKILGIHLDFSFVRKIVREISLIKPMKTHCISLLKVSDNFCMIETA